MTITELCNTLSKEMRIRVFDEVNTKIADFSSKETVPSFISFSLIKKIIPISGDQIDLQIYAPNSTYGKALEAIARAEELGLCIVDRQGNLVVSMESDEGDYWAKQSVFDAALELRDDPDGFEFVVQRNKMAECQE